ncbi:uncharacterized protein LOC143186505 [Calliopsis andreniformis]|uniref:uncharacterized protein LOC143186505 n=1 Tax=Calliopsis andreniformis TaxID=337506 RepID=UPI003FCE890E
MYTSQDYYRMIWVFVENRGDAVATARTYAEEYPHLRRPDASTIRNMAQLFYTTGSVMPRGSELGWPRSSRSRATTERLLQASELTALFGRFSKATPPFFIARHFSPQRP